jgi:hypothetical protein
MTGLMGPGENFGLRHPVTFTPNHRCGPRKGFTTGSAAFGPDDPVITDPDPQPRPVTLQRADTRGPGIIGESAHRG